jgi:hypothetical protein
MIDIIPRLGILAKSPLSALRPAGNDATHALLHPAKSIVDLSC